MRLCHLGDIDSDESAADADADERAADEAADMRAANETDIHEVAASPAVTVTLQRRCARREAGGRSSGRLLASVVCKAEDVCKRPPLLQQGSSYRPLQIAVSACPRENFCQEEEGRSVNLAYSRPVGRRLACACCRSPCHTQMNTPAESCLNYLTSTSGSPRATSRGIQSSNHPC